MTLRTALAVLILAAPGALRPALAEDFRVENQVFVDGEEKPSVESTTIFYNGAVYDYLKAPAETLVFDPEHGRFVLLDTTRRMKTELTTKEVVDFTERLRQRAAADGNAFLKFQAAPTFEQQFDESSRELTFRSDWVTYRVVTVDAQSQEIAEQYRDFADALARLNTVINSRALPPFARLLVNSEIERREELPREVHVTVNPPGVFPRKRITLRSEHQLVRRLVESDRTRVTQTGQFMAIFQPVSFEEYQKIDSDR